MRNKDQYHESWVDTIRPAILKRDNYKCKDCGIKHRSYVLVDSNKNRTLIEKDEYEDYKTYGANTYRIYLQVAHLDNNKANNDYENLLALCPVCHNLRDKEWKRVIRLSEKKKEMKKIIWLGGGTANVKLIG